MCINGNQHSIKKMIYHNKLVRDKIPQIIQSKGKFCKFRKLDKQDYVIELRNKLKEEFMEYLSDPCKEELADIIEVIDALAQSDGLTLSDILKVKEKNSIKIDKCFFIGIKCISVFYPIKAHGLCSGNPHLLSIPKFLSSISITDI